MIIFPNQGIFPDSLTNAGESGINSEVKYERKAD